MKEYKMLTKVTKGIKSNKLNGNKCTKTTTKIKNKNNKKYINKKKNK